LREHGGAEIVRHVEVKVPTEVNEGRLDLIVASGTSWTDYDLKMRPFRPMSFSDEIRLVDKLMPATRLVVALETKDPGVSLQGGNVPVPVGVQAALAAGLGPDVEGSGYRVLERTELDLNVPMVGAKRIPLQVWRPPAGRP
jgi:hypothetical protein